MKRLLIATAALSLIAGAGGAANAQPYGNAYGHDRHDNHDQYSNDKHDQGGRDHYGQGRQAHQDWRRGGRIARNDWNRGQRVDYRRHHLRAPPRGYEWRQVDNNYVLAAVATGLIASILAANN